MKWLLPLILLFGACSASAQAAVPAPPFGLDRIPVVLLVDLGSGRTLYARDPERRFLPASVTKVMTAYVTAKWLAERRLWPEMKLTVRPQVFAEWNGKGTSMNLRSGEEVPIDALIRGITAISANDAAAVLAEQLNIIAQMNREAQDLKMQGSMFATPSGWPDQGRTYVTARDLAKLADALITRYPAFYSRYFGQREFTWNGMKGFNKDPVTGVVPGADGIKTGHTDEAGYNFLGSAEREGRRLVVVVAGANSEEERAQASRGLLEWGFSEWNTRPLFAKDTIVGVARVQEGALRQVALRPGRAVYATLPKGSGEPVSLRLIYRGPLRAPIAEGKQVAELEITADRYTNRVPLFAAESVGKANAFQRLVNGLAGLFS